ncbi:MAG: HlyD family efflux transporter periplasmic adaptor subunit [Prosthecobacter sp.]|nr:HlyD family efflux transporter periplasmic adaptor subunit [Prosthecobacter sp.]
MKRFHRLWQLAAAACLLGACDHKESSLLQGYIEGEYVYVAAPLAGALETLSVERGAQVKAGDSLFQLENGLEKAALSEAERRVTQARANLEDAKKGRRPSEIAALAAQRQQAQSALELSEREFQRQEKLATTGATSVENVDRARSTADQNRAHIAQIEADLATAKLGAREDQIAAAEAAIRMADAAQEQAAWSLLQKNQHATQAGQVFDTMYRPGEWVAAGRPVVAILPPQNIKVRFFVPQARLAALKQGDAVSIHVDGVDSPFKGTISFVSPQAEYTPPVIYSNDNRAKLVFMIEAVFPPEVAARLHPGQPVDVQLDAP